MKPPKQFPDWLKAAKFERPNKRHKGRKYFYWRGMGRHWRINCDGHMEVSYRYADFDRWANSVVYTDTVHPIPTNKQMFLAQVKFIMEEVNKIQIPSSE